MEFDKLKQIIAEILSLDPREIREDMTFEEDLCADSLDVYQIIMEIEDEFGIEISAEAAEGVRTVGDAVELIKSVKQH